MKTNWKLMAAALIAGGTMFAQTRLSVGVGVGVGGYDQGYYPPPAYASQYAPPSPGPGYTWVDGYWAPQGGRNVWTKGFWRAPVVARRYVAPRYRQSFRDHDRDDFNRGRERSDDHNRGNSYRR